MTEIQKKYNISDARAIEIAVGLKNLKNITLNAWSQEIIDNICYQLQITKASEKEAISEMIYNFIIHSKIN
ncbi:MAG TPA: hypothetical protein VGB37_08580 [Candidatus Lokiarchaeia archaeon]